MAALENAEDNSAQLIKSTANLEIVKKQDNEQPESAKVSAPSTSDGCEPTSQSSLPTVTAIAVKSNQDEATTSANPTAESNPITDGSENGAATDSTVTADPESKESAAAEVQTEEQKSDSTINGAVKTTDATAPETTRKRKSSRWGAPPKKRRKNRWADKKPNSSLGNLVGLNGNFGANSAMAQAMFGTKEWDEKQLKIIGLRNKLQEVSTRLIAPGAWAVPTQNETEKSPSPEPVYDSKGIRINTREYRMKEKLKKQRIEIIQQLLAVDPNYQAPSDYKPPKLTAKITMPVEEYPDYNFFGLIVGPRGNTQKEMQTKTGCKIAVRGQGASDMDKPGKMVHPDDNEPLHVHITAPNQESLDKATTLINNLIEEVKNGGVEHKARQFISFY